MRIRLSKNVKLTTNIEVLPAHLHALRHLYLYRLSKMLKHGVSGNKESFIDIQLKENLNGEVEFICTNSAFPKNESDKSGSGID